MLDYGFSNFHIVKLTDTNETVTTLPLLNGVKKNVSVHAKQNLIFCARKNHGSIIEKVELNRPRFAPIYQGDVVGQISFISDGKIIAVSPLCATEYVGAKTKNKSFIYKFFK